MDPTHTFFEAVRDLESRINFLEDMLKVVAEESHELRKYISRLPPPPPGSDGMRQHPYRGWMNEAS